MDVSSKSREQMTNWPLTAKNNSGIKSTASLCILAADCFLFPVQECEGSTGVQPDITKKTKQRKTSTVLRMFVMTLTNTWRARALKEHRLMVKCKRHSKYVRHEIHRAQDCHAVLFFFLFRSEETPKKMRNIVQNANFLFGKTKQKKHTKKQYASRQQLLTLWQHKQLHLGKQGAQHFPHLQAQPCQAFPTNVRVHITFIRTAVLGNLPLSHTASGENWAVYFSWCYFGGECSFFKIPQHTSVLHNTDFYVQR